MTYLDALKRATATFVVGATATPAASALLNVSTLKVAAIAGIFGVWNLAGRSAQAYLNANPEGI